MICGLYKLELPQAYGCGEEEVRIEQFVDNATDFVATLATYRKETRSIRGRQYIGKPGVQEKGQM